LSPASTAGAPPRTLLLVEDHPGDARLVQERLKRDWTRNLDVHPVTRLDEAVGHLRAHRTDCILLDLSLPDSAGCEGVRTLIHAFPDVPVVILSGTNDEGLVLECLHEGAQDYLVKDEVDGALIARSVRYAVERKRAERGLQSTGEAQRRLYRLSTAGVGLMLLLLTAFAIGAVTVTKSSTDRLEEASALAAAYGEAVQATAEEARALGDYALRGVRVERLRADHRRAPSRSPRLSTACAATAPPKTASAPTTPSGRTRATSRTPQRCSPRPTPAPRRPRSLDGSGSQPEGSDRPSGSSPRPREPSGA